jgi:hypothetical protein
MTTETKAQSVCSPVFKLFKTKYKLTKKTRNWTGANKPCTQVHRLASRLARCSGVYKIWGWDCCMTGLDCKRTEATLKL